MKCDIILAGVGGQGVLSISSLIATAALQQGLHVKQSEVHGMAQRGGAVQAHLRLADHTIHSDLIPKGSADLILSMEPIEGLRYLDYLSTAGALITSKAAVENIPDYPPQDEVLRAIVKLPRARVIDAAGLARKAGSARATNVVMVGAAAGLLPVGEELIRRTIRAVFARKGERTVETNLAAFNAGREAAAPARPTTA
ncbi:MAG: indolepyruvate oxidoreductase subunit beta [Deltaproteobacteria bacterium]|nr:indolepyruvate oxidoreductase subunit beta [Deltaproteobacteria bacterium]